MFSYSPAQDREDAGHRPWSAEAVPVNLFFALLPEPGTVPPISQLGEIVCGAHRFRGKPIWPDRLHLTLLPVGNPHGGLEESVRRARIAAARVRAMPFEIALDITESFSVRDRYPFVLGSGDGLHKFTALQKVLAYEMACEGFEGLSRISAPHMTLMWADRDVGEYPIAPIRWTVRDFVLVRSHVGQSRHEHIGRWPLRG
ncbi:MAG TPA: 2'-5' RNA ligase family protein [Rhizomicrobium sp.]|nr:2'-5' RNA ligase family protein [Rhizomicrobium sp.]